MATLFSSEPRPLASQPLPDLQQNWAALTPEERLAAFKAMAREEAEDFFNLLEPTDQSEILIALPDVERRWWLRQLEPDDITDILQELSEDQRGSVLALLDVSTKKEVMALLAFAEDEAGGLMSPRYARVRPDMSVDEAIMYLHKQARGQVETIYYCYVLDSQQRLMGVVSFRELFVAPSAKRVNEVMQTAVVTVPLDMDQETLSQLFAQHDLIAIPVVDAEGRMHGIVTVDDIVDVVKEEATEDIQRLGGTEALDAPYLNVSFLHMLRKRAGWLTVLFLGEMLTATAMAYYEHQIAKAVVLALFIPLIISSGGNSGSQASTLVVRAIALGEVKLTDWWRVLGREILMGLSLGVLLGGIGLLRILFWPNKEQIYGEHYILVGATVSISLIGIVLWGSVSGSMLPFMLRRLGFDPASASAPFVATLVDVFGVILYFTVAGITLHGILL